MICDFNVSKQASSTNKIFMLTKKATVKSSTIMQK